MRTRASEERGCIVPLDSLTNEARNSLIDEFISRETDILTENRENMRAKVVASIRRGDALITYDAVTKSTNVVLRSEFERLARSE